MKGLAKQACDQLLIHQFLVGLSESVSQQLRVIGNTWNLNRLAERAKIMIMAMEQERVSAITTKDFPVKGTDFRVLCAISDIEEPESSIISTLLPPTFPVIIAA